jgi:hypothetical protein
MALPYVKSQKEYMLFYKQHKEMIDMEAKVYSEIFNDRKVLGGNDKIHKIETNGTRRSSTTMEQVS